MKQTEIVFIIATILLWILVIASWIIFSKAQSDNHSGKENFSFIKLIGTSLIIYLPLLTGRLISTPLFQTSLTSGLIGLTFCILGITIMLWARQHLAKNWSGNIILQTEHTITKDGPYKFVRHPIYSGGLLAMLGSAIVVGQIFGFAWALLCSVGLIMKIRQEEILLSSKFPTEYSAYKKQTKTLIPFVW